MATKEGKQNDDEAEKYISAQVEKTSAALRENQLNRDKQTLYFAASAIAAVILLVPKFYCVEWKSMLGLGIIFNVICIILNLLSYICSTAYQHKTIAMLNEISGSVAGNIKISNCHKISEFIETRSKRVRKIDRWSTVACMTGIVFLMIFFIHNL